MPKWELRTEGCAMPLARDIESGVWIGHSEVAEYFVHHHNADIDALTAERDELQRRLGAVVAMLKPAQIKWSKVSMDSPEYHAWCLIVPLYGAALAIAEGREG